MVSTLNKWIVSDYRELVKEREGVVLVGLDRVSVEEAQEIRLAISDAGAEFRLAKNRLAKVALKEEGIPISDEAFEGTCALLVGDTEATIVAAKAIEGFWKSRKVESKTTFRAAFMDGAAMTAEEAARIPAMPDRQTLRGMMCGALSGPARMLATLASQVPASLARGLQARADQEAAA